MDEVSTLQSAPSTAAVADGCLRESVSFRMAPPELRPLFSTSPIAGRALAVRHEGSVDVFLEAYNDARPGDVLVIDNAGRRDEGCIGDLSALEGQRAGVVGCVIWGLHRDSAELRTLKFPVWSLGACPAGPNRKTAVRGSVGQATIADQLVRTGDWVVADDDGVLFVAAPDAPKVMRAAHEIIARERAQAQEVARGRSLREQFRFADYVRERAKDPSYTLRQHLRRLRAEIEI